jgi:acyl-CoA thioesterase I
MLDGQTILVLGDSLSDGDWENDPHKLGSAWPSAAKRLLKETGGPALSWINRSRGGSRSLEVLQEWLAWKSTPPDLLVVGTGVNDHWRHFVPWLDHTPIPPKQFGQNLSRLIYDALDKGVGSVCICTPTSIHTDPDHEWNQGLEEYRAWCHEVADATDSLLIPTGEEWMEALRSHPEIRWTYDGVHPRPVGHERLGHTWVAHMLGKPGLPTDQLPDQPKSHRLGSWP